MNATATHTHESTPITDPRRLLGSEGRYSYPHYPVAADVLVASPHYGTSRYDIFRRLSDRESGNYRVYVGSHAIGRYSCTFDTLHDARCAARRDAGTGHPTPAQPTPTDIHRAHWRRTLTARQVLADPKMRDAAYEQAEQWNRKSCASGVLAWASDAAVAEAVQIMRGRLARRVNHTIASAARHAPAGRIAAMLRAREQERRKHLAEYVAEILDQSRPLCESQYGGIVWGAGGAEVVEWDRYSTRCKWPCKYRNAGVYLDEHLCVHVDDSRGREMFVSRPLKKSDWRKTDLRRAAAKLLGCMSEAALDRIGEQGDDDAVQIRTPYRICKSLLGTIIADHPTRPDIVQVVVRDATTGQRHHLTVPPRFGRAVRKPETAHSRCQAAIAWTFGIPASQYKPRKQA